MSTLHRAALIERIKSDLNKKMVFLGGPRQVGKTTLAQSLLKDYFEGHHGYLNWDRAEHRNKILNASWSSSEPLLVLDEIHKFKNWRNLIKGYYDTLKKTHRFLVTGSARLDFFRKGGDALLGRFYYHRLHPFHVDDLPIVRLNDLFKFGGFPEPLLSLDPVELKRWHLQRRERVIYSDIRDFESIRDISLIELLIDALPERVGAPLSRKNLAEDIQIDQKTVERWLQILERVYYAFRISPYGAPKIKAVKKEQKLYLWDWSEHDDEGKRWENFIASLLLKFCHYREDNFGDKMDLRYIRDQLGREVDFVVIKNKKPLFAVEAKLSLSALSSHIEYFMQRTPVPIFFQVHKDGPGRSVNDRIKMIPLADFTEFLMKLY